jgi:hypothetical protein
MHVGAARQLAFVKVRRLRNACAQHGKCQEQDNAAAPSRLSERPNGERTTGDRFA